jgi:molecular chaperone HtpG
VLVDAPFSIGAQMERYLRQTGQEPPPRKRILELNPEHPLIARMSALQAADAGSAKLKDYADVLYGQALLTEGSPLPDAPRFAKLVTEMMLAATG